MAIGTTAAILGSAVIGAGASAIAGSKNSKAINKATEAQAQGNAQSVALQRDIYGQNKSALAPFMSRGNAAGDQINALLGLGGVPTATVQSMPMNPAQAAFGAPEAFGGSALRNKMMASRGSAVYPMQPSSYASSPAPSPAVTQQSAENAFDVFRNSTGYQFRVGEGMEALNSGYAGSGMMQSGAALKALDDYRQQAASAEFGNYLSYLGNQQGVGIAGASALAGVGQGYANNITALNNQNSNAIANAAVAKANNSNAMWGGIGGAVSGALGQYAYRPGGM